VKDKAPDDVTYNYVVEQLQPVIDELQLSLPDELGLQ
jgi:cytochrome c oxidase subunit 5a